MKCKKFPLEWLYTPQFSSHQKKCPQIGLGTFFRFSMRKKVWLEWLQEYAFVPGREESFTKKVEKKIGCFPKILFYLYIRSTYLFQYVLFLKDFSTKKIYKNSQKKDGYSPAYVCRQSSSSTIIYETLLIGVEGARLLRKC